MTIRRTLVMSLMLMAACDSDSDDGSEAPDPGGPQSSGSSPTGPAATTASPSTTAGDDDGDDEDDDDAGDDDDAPMVPELDCGERFVDTEGLRRHPYLQSIEPTSARIAWTTTRDAAGFVRIAPSPDGPWTEVQATSKLFETAYTGDTEDYFAYDATVKGLQPNTPYCYEVHEGDRRLAAGLTLQSAWTTPQRPVRILAFGDSGDFSPSQLGLRDQMMKHDFDVFLHLGDMAYGDGTHSQFEERVFGVYRELLQETPTYPAIGNHEYSTNDGQPYLDVYYLWEMALRDEDQERYYSFDYGDVHFVSLDSNNQLLLPAYAYPEDSMLQWLEDDLDSSAAPWKIAFFHHPPYSSSERSPNLVVREALLPILEEGEVDLVLSGHDHHYERTEAILEGNSALHQDGGIYYFVVGSGGAGLRAAMPQWWSEVVDDQNHAFLNLTIETAVQRALVSQLPELPADERVLHADEVAHHRLRRLGRGPLGVDLALASLLGGELLLDRLALGALQHVDAEVVELFVQLLELRGQGELFVLQLGEARVHDELELQRGLP